MWSPPFPVLSPPALMMWASLVRHWSCHLTVEADETWVPRLVFLSRVSVGKSCPSVPHACSCGMKTLTWRRTQMNW